MPNLVMPLSLHSAMTESLISPSWDSPSVTTTITLAAPGRPPLLWLKPRWLTGANRQISQRRRKEATKDGRSGAANQPGVLNGVEGIGGVSVHLRDPGCRIQHVFFRAVLVQSELKLGIDGVLDDTDLGGKETQNKPGKRSALDARGARCWYLHALGPDVQGGN